MLCLIFGRQAHAGVEQLGEKEFRQLAGALAPKVSLFRAIWDQDPNAEFYGGTSRDYLYWLKGKFQDAQTPAEAKQIADSLRKEAVIDIREFIIGDSDVDVVSQETVGIKPQDYGVRKFDRQPSDIFDPKSEAGFNELNQGYAPAEKIRLGSRGIVENPGLGDGAKEIFTGKLTVHFAEPKLFAATKYAKEGINHPTLLALRYIRLQAINYFRTHGAGYPDRAKLLDNLDPASTKAVKAILGNVTQTDELKPFLGREKFTSWVNGTIQKAFRSYTNPTAALLLMRELGVDKLVAKYADIIEPINQYVFVKSRDEVQIAKNLKKSGVLPKDLYLDPKAEFPDGFFYHGTKTEPAFRGILFQGISPSTVGAVGPGLYGVAAKNKKYSEEWAGSRERLLRFPVNPDAKIIDITEGPGKKLWEAWKDQADFDGFADHYGADFLKYPYVTEAYVVKNAAILGKAEGVHRKIMPLSKLIEAVKIVDNVDDAISLIRVNSLTSAEASLVAKASSLSRDEIRRAVAKIDFSVGEGAMERHTRNRILLQNFFAQKAGPKDRKLAAQIMARGTPLEKKSLISNAFVEPAWLEQKNFLLELIDGSEKEIVSELYESLGRAGFFDEHPEMLLERFRAAPWDESLAPHYVTQGMKDWNKHPDLFREFLRRFKENEKLQNSLDYIAANHIGLAILHSDVALENPEILLDWNSYLHRRGKKNLLDLWQNSLADAISPGRTPWVDHPLLKRLTGRNPAEPSSLHQYWDAKKSPIGIHLNWVEEKRKKLLLTNEGAEMRSIRDPFIFLEQANLMGIDPDRVAIFSGIPAKSWEQLIRESPVPSIQSAAFILRFADHADPESAKLFLEFIENTPKENKLLREAMKQILSRPEWQQLPEVVSAFSGGYKKKTKAELGSASCQTRFKELR